MSEKDKLAHRIWLRGAAKRAKDSDDVVVCEKCGCQGNMDCGHIPLDETIDASYAVGQALPRELRCTAAGGIAVAPSARSLTRSR